MFTAKEGGAALGAGSSQPVAIVCVKWRAIWACITWRTWANARRGSNDLMRRFMPSVPSVPRDPPF